MQWAEWERGLRCLLIWKEPGRDRQSPAWVCVRQQREHKNVTHLVKPVPGAGVFLLWLFLALGKEGRNRCCLAAFLRFRSRGIFSAVIYGHRGPGCAVCFPVFGERQSCSPPKPSACTHSMGSQELTQKTVGIQISGTSTWSDTSMGNGLCPSHGSRCLWVLPHSLPGAGQNIQYCHYCDDIIDFAVNNIVQKISLHVIIV